MEKILQFYSSLYSHNQIWIKKAVWWFLGSVLIGIVAFYRNPDLLLTILETYQEKFGANPALDFNLAWQIFIQNLLVSVVAIFGGIILGSGALLVIVVNGFLLGYVITSLFSLANDSVQSLALVLGGLLPHGIFEIPAFLFAAALGLRLGWEWMYKTSAGNRGAVFWANFKQSLFSLPGIALVLFIAALIEVFVSGSIVERL